MAKDNEEKAKKPDQAPPPEPIDDFLIEMRKDSETLRVHPTCVKGHREAGWK